MGDRGFNAGGFAYMPRVKCVKCGAIFPIGNSNPRRECSNTKACEARAARKPSGAAGPGEKEGSV